MKKRMYFLMVYSLSVLYLFTPAGVLAEEEMGKGALDQLNLQLDQLDQEIIERKDLLWNLSLAGAGKDENYFHNEEQLARLEAEYQVLEMEYLIKLEEKANISSFQQALPSAQVDRGVLNWPTTSRQLTSPFGMRHHPIYRLPKMHQGIDIAGGGIISSAESGRVSFVGNRGGYGYTIIIDHEDGWRSLYAHLADQSARVNVGEKVKRNQPIGVMGTTGNSTGVHLHFEVHVDQKAVDPMLYLE